MSFVTLRRQFCRSESRSDSLTPRIKRIRGLGMIISTLVNKELGEFLVDLREDGYKISNH